MVSRRRFIRVGTAAVGSLALRPLGLLPALAQSGPDYRALVCVFLFGGNDSNNTVIPMDDANYQAYMSIRGSLALTGSNLTPAVTSVSGAPYAFSCEAGGSREYVFEQGTRGGCQHGRAGTAADASAVSESTSGDSFEPVLALRSATGVANLHRAGPQPDGLGGPRRGLHCFAELSTRQVSRRFSRWPEMRWRGRV